MQKRNRLRNLALHFDSEEEEENTKEKEAEMEEVDSSDENKPRRKSQKRPKEPVSGAM